MNRIDMKKTMLAELRAAGFEILHVYTSPAMHTFMLLMLCMASATYPRKSREVNQLKAWGFTLSRHPPSYAMHSGG
tara:strand:+ start:2564 stop:2791 length:228 start_codon:yes stop_codon:yes gene_type:complete